MAFSAYVMGLGDSRPQPPAPADNICRWCQYFTHAETERWWWDYRCGLDVSKVDMWGTCKAYRLHRRGEGLAVMSAHEKAAALALKGNSYHVVK